MRKNLIFCWLLLIAFVLQNCKKITCGCTVSTDTTNFNKLAECDNGTCIFISRINLVPDSVEKYHVNIYIDSQFRERLTKIIDKDGPDNPDEGYVEKFASDEIHRYKVEDDFGKVWEDTFRTNNRIKDIKSIYLKR